MMFLDEFKLPLPGGTAIKDPCTKHEGIVAYERGTGRQLMLHNSPRIGQAALTEPSAFTDGKCKLLRTRVPQSPAESEAIVQRAWSEVQKGTRWTVFDNCEDFVSRAYTGKSGSATRNFCVGVAAVLGLCAIAVGASRS